MNRLNVQETVLAIKREDFDVEIKSAKLAFFRAFDYFAHVNI